MRCSPSSTPSDLAASTTLAAEVRVRAWLRRQTRVTHDRRGPRRRPSWSCQATYDACDGTRLSARTGTGTTLMLRLKDLEAMRWIGSKGFTSMQSGRAGPTPRSLWHPERCGRRTSGRHFDALCRIDVLQLAGRQVRQRMRTGSRGQSSNHNAGQLERAGLERDQVDGDLSGHVLLLIRPSERSWMPPRPLPELQILPSAGRPSPIRRAPVGSQTSCDGLGL
jgi:hypothetical protein